MCIRDRFNARHGDELQLLVHTLSKCDLYRDMEFMLSLIHISKAPLDPTDPMALFAITASGTKVWVANLNSVIEINASNGSVERVISAKADRLSMPIDIAVSNSHVWVMNNVQPGKMCIRDSF